MNWDDLRLFLALVRSSRLASAARLVGLDATTVARRMQRLERTLEITLFEQASSGHLLTEQGRRLLEHAEMMEAAALRIAPLPERDGNALAGTIRLSVSEGFGSRILAPQLHRFTRPNPLVTLELIASTGFLNPSRREADIAVMLARPKAGPLITKKLVDYHLGLYAAASYAGTMPPIAAVADLIEHRLISYVPDLIYSPELHYLAELDPRLQASVRSSSINAQAELIASGAGCGILPCFIGDQTAGLRRVLHDGIDIRRSFWLVTHRDVRGIARIDRFVDWLNHMMAELLPLMSGRPGRR